MPKTYDVKEIANYFIKKSNYSISPMKLQKLIYYAHGWHLAIHDTPLINNELEAWQFGPVIREIYQDVKRYGNQDVSELIQKFDFNDWSFDTPELDDPEASEFLDAVYNAYGSFSAIKLSDMTHTPNAPWDIARKTGLNTINNEIIKNYFVNLANTKNSDA